MPLFDLLLDGFVAFTACFFELRSIHNLYFTPRILDESCFLQDASSESDARSPRSEHLSEQILRQRQAMISRTVRAHQQPASEALFNFMKAVASSNLCDLHGHDLRELLQPQGQAGATKQALGQYIGIDAESGTANLHVCPERGGTKSRNERQPHKTLFADKADLDAFAIGKDVESGDHAAVAEVGGPDGIAHFVQHLKRVQPHEFELGENQVAFLAREAQQDFIVDLIAIGIGIGRLRRCFCNWARGFFDHEAPRAA